MFPQHLCTIYKAQLNIFKEASAHLWHRWPKKKIISAVPLITTKTIQNGQGRIWLLMSSTDYFDESLDNNSASSSAAAATWMCSVYLQLCVFQHEQSVDVQAPQMHLDLIRGIVFSSSFSLMWKSLCCLFQLQILCLFSLMFRPNLCFICFSQRNFVFPSAVWINAWRSTNSGSQRCLPLEAGLFSVPRVLIPGEEPGFDIVKSPVKFRWKGLKTNTLLKNKPPQRAGERAFPCPPHAHIHTEPLARRQLLQLVMLDTHARTRSTGADVALTKQEERRYWKESARQNVSQRCCCSVTKPSLLSENEDDASDRAHKHTWGVTLLSGPKLESVRDLRIMSQSHAKPQLHCRFSAKWRNGATLWGRAV